MSHSAGDELLPTPEAVALAARRAVLQAMASADPVERARIRSLAAAAGSAYVAVTDPGPPSG